MSAAESSQPPECLDFLDSSAIGLTFGLFALLHTAVTMTSSAHCT